MCQIDINEIPDIYPALQMTILQELRQKRIEHQKMQDIFKIQRIEKIVCDHFNITSSQVRLNSRDPKICIPRNIIFFLSIETTRLKEDDIGECYGFKRGRVHHSKKVISDLIDTDKVFRAKFNEIESKII